jgi:hypothetical protein
LDKVYSIIGRIGEFMSNDTWLEDLDKELSRVKVKRIPVKKAPAPVQKQPVCLWDWL